MSKLPQIKPFDLIKFFKKQEFVVLRQVGSHARLAHPDGRKITIAIHNNTNFVVVILGSVATPESNQLEILDKPE